MGMYCAWLCVSCERLGVSGVCLGEGNRSKTCNSEGKRPRCQSYFVKIAKIYDSSVLRFNITKHQNFHEVAVTKLDERRRRRTRRRRSNNNARAFENPGCAQCPWVAALGEPACLRKVAGPSSRGRLGVADTPSTKERVVLKGCL